MEKESKYEKAKKRVEEIKGWYMHLFIYILINLAFTLFNFGVFDGGTVSGHIPWWSSLTMPVGWGIGLLFHWIYAFKGNFYSKRLKEWEARKIQEYLEKDKEEQNQNL